MDKNVKHDWEHVPDSGSVTRPYRFNCRLDPSERAQLMGVMHWIKVDILKDENAPLCECLLKGVLALQHLQRHIAKATPFKGFKTEHIISLKILSARFSSIP